MLIEQSNIAGHDDNSSVQTITHADSSQTVITFDSNQHIFDQQEIAPLGRRSLDAGLAVSASALNAPALSATARGQGEERGQAPAAAAAPEPIVTHEARVKPWPGGMSFHEAHQRRDEPEDTPASSLRPVGRSAVPNAVVLNTTQRTSANEACSPRQA